MADLLGEDGPAAPRRSPELNISAMRAALTGYGRGAESNGSLPCEQLERELGAVWAAYQESRYGSVVNRLPSLLIEARAAASATCQSDRRQAQSILALSYQAATAILTKLGEVDLAWVAADRGLNTAQATENPLVICSLSRSVVHALQATGRYQEAVALVDDTSSSFGPKLRSGNETSVSVYGSLFLAGSIAAARLGDRTATRAHLAQAGAAADRMAGDGNELWTSFGPTNVAIHRVATSMEFGDTHTALDVGSALDTSVLPTERRVRHSLEIARAYSRSNRKDEALTTLLMAERLAPEQVRVHFLAQQVVRDLVRANRGRPSGELSALATRLGALN
ncbi:XRE family transcriptional regulator [Lentzea kentuckyensis]|uniref:XRE family transcriptional regulator n=1 Tax=Lentzea kentuckyensis TaxID=360086 RepID=UPI001FEC376A|nr:XRE family transcriptional regulator [Lentzea kentuckyensis]